MKEAIYVADDRRPRPSARLTPLVQLLVSANDEVLLVHSDGGQRSEEFDLDVHVDSITADQFTLANGAVTLKLATRAVLEEDEVRLVPYLDLDLIAGMTDEQIQTHYVQTMFAGYA